MKASKNMKIEMNKLKISKKKIQPLEEVHELEETMFWTNHQPSRAVKKHFPAPSRR